MSKMYYEVEVLNGNSWQRWCDVDEEVIEYPSAKVAFQVKQYLETRQSEPMQARVWQVFCKRTLIETPTMVLTI